MNDSDYHGNMTSNVHTFDLIGFRGTDFISKFIIHLERKAIKNKHIHIATKISHIGIVLEGRDLVEFSKEVETSRNLFDAVDENRVYIFESTASGRILDKIPDVCGQYCFGAQLRDLEDVIKNYRGEIFHSARLFPVNGTQMSQLMHFVGEYNHRPYERSFGALFGNIWKGFRNITNTNSVFCSELVTIALKRCKILHESINPEHVVPMDFYPDPENPEKTLDVDGKIPLIYNSPVPFHRTSESFNDTNNSP